MLKAKESNRVQDQLAQEKKTEGHLELLKTTHWGSFLNSLQPYVIAFTNEPSGRDPIGSDLKDYKVTQIKRQ
jgi:hypothetical protein